LTEGLLEKEKPSELAMEVLTANANESLATAELILKNNGSDLWVIVCSYYSMFYIGNVVLRRLGYKVGNKIAHQVTADALIAFVRNKLKNTYLEEYQEAKDEALELAGVRADTLIESFDFEKIKRGRLQYQTDKEDKKSKAITSIERARRFMIEMGKLVSD
jgi:uncharacterized protein (UPF0332 family)